jgi:hypothetical protein
MSAEAVRLLQAVVDGVLDRAGAFGLFALEDDGSLPSPATISRRASELLVSEEYMHSGTRDTDVRS